MLRQIEEALARKELWTMQELAASLGVRPELLRAGLEHLMRIGRLPDGALVQLGACSARPECSTCVLTPACRGRRS